MTSTAGYLRMEQVIADRILDVNYKFMGKLLLIPGILFTFQKMPQSGWICTPLKLLARTSFGLFFWHGYVIVAIKLCYQPAATANDAELMLFVVVQLVLVLTLILPVLLFVRQHLGPRSAMVTGY